MQKVKGCRMRFISGKNLNIIKCNNGETLVETLISTLIVSAVVLMLATAVVTAARVNTAIETEDVVFNSNEAHSLSDSGGSISIAVTTNGNQKDSVGTIEGYYTDNGYVYYTYKRQ